LSLYDDGQDTLEILLWDRGMVGNGEASIGNGKRELAIIKHRSSELMFASIFILEWNNSVRQYLGFNE